jgi:hypothetical protein
MCISELCKWLVAEEIAFDFVDAKARTSLKIKHLSKGSVC